MINVYLLLEGKKHKVGKLLKTDNGVFFQYDKPFLKLGLPLSPFNLPLNNQVFKAPDEPFNQLHGLFADSLPDGWGLLLMDRYLRQKGINISSVTALDRLLYVGSTAMGALIYEPDLSEQNTETKLDVSALSQEAEKVYAGSTDDVLPELLKVGTSPGGARPKIIVGMQGDQVIAGEHDLPQGYEAWLIKFHTNIQPHSEEGLIEEAYSQLLKKSSVNMPETKLLNVNDKQFFAVKRFDRFDNKRLHVHSLAGLIHANFRVLDFDYEKFLKITSLLTKKDSDVEQAFRQMVFNILAVNCDDHTKNFSFIMNYKGEWRLSPAYDVTFNVGRNHEQSMSIAGFGKNIPERTFYELGEIFELDDAQVKQIFVETCDSLSHWHTTAKSLGVCNSTIQDIQKEIDRQFNQYRSLIISTPKPY